MGTPLRSRSSQDQPDEASPQSYEALLISALVESGRFNPEAHHVSKDDIVGWGKVWAFCHDYQAASGKAPPEHLLAKHHPEFQLTPGISVAWAASKVLEESASRDLRARTQASIAALKDGDVEGAFEPFDNLQRPRTLVAPPASIFDVSSVAAEFEVERVEVPFPTLRRMLNGGLTPGEYLVLAARLGQGKSHIACHFASRAMQAGWRCAYLSLEMPRRQVSLRTLKHLCGSSYELFDALNGDDEIEMKKAVEALQERTPGTLDVFDPSMGNVGTTSMFEDLCRDYDYVLVDHVGLMKTAKGQRAIEDWRIQSTVSNVIREVILDTGTPSLVIAQVNRAGEHHGSMATPRASELAQSDAIGQDATAIITMKRLSRTIMKYSLEKSRDGATGPWFGRFDPARNRWDELSKEVALDISADDDAMD